ncbi:MAG TPA: hypothetical protein VK666_03870 [Chryseolinea sp.]|nr:hypothetical protein [Chryseolinea sp.]
MLRLRLLLFSAMILSACNMATPEKYFGVAVLNCNMMMSFAGEDVPRDISEPSGKMDPANKDKVIQMTHKEMVDSKVEFFEENLGKLRKLKETAETKEMLDASLALNGFVIPVYRNEYQQLAKLYDDGASQNEIQAFNKSIHDKYAVKFVELFDRVTKAGKAYAARNNIKVQWGVGQ